MKTKILLVIAILGLLAAPVAAQEFVPPADAVVLDMSVSDGTNLNHLGTLYCVTGE